MERLVNKIFIAAFAILGTVAFIGAVGFGAYHHYATAAICAILVKVLKHENSKG